MGPSSLSAAPLLGTAGAVFAGVSALAWGAVASRSQFFGRTICHTGKPNTVALTFDDGPNPALTPRVLKVLEENDVRATFFLIGEFVQQCEELAQEIALRGHTIGNHTQTHRPLFWMRRQQITDELVRCQDAIESACGVRPAWMRPPFGVRSPQLSSAVRRAGLSGVVMWSRSTRDWRPRSITETVYRFSLVRGGDIVLMHDGDHRQFAGNRNHTLAGLDYWLPMWKSAGLEFVTLDELAGAGQPQPASSLDSPRPATDVTAQRSVKFDSGSPRPESKSIAAAE